jgi:hypothetical protein
MAERPTIGFILLRCVRKVEDNLLWKTCYQRIRQFYSYPILVVSDHCRPEILETDFPTVNTQFVESPADLSGSAEILPYYFFYHLHPFDRAIVIHDSMFFRTYFDFGAVHLVDVIFLWEFGSLSDHHQYEIELLQTTADASTSLAIFNSRQWSGCNGGAAMITWDCVKNLEESFHFLIWTTYLNRRREYRNSFERAFAILCYRISATIKDHTSLFGHLYYIPNSPCISNLSEIDSYQGPSPLIKICRGR